MIIYFTGTGNSRIIAEKLGELLEDDVADSFRAIRNGGHPEYISEKPFVFVCPTYAWDIPHIFRSFLLSSRFTGSPLAYFLMTCGSSIGDPSKGLKKLCTEKGLTFRGVKAVVMPENYAAMFPVPGQEKADRIIAKALESLPATAEEIKNEKSFPVVVSLFGRLQTVTINRPFYKLFVSADKFHAEPSCTGCGACEKVCPLSNIRFADGHPTWGNSCTHCMACISVCPEKAVQYGKGTEKKNRIYNGKVR